MGSDRDGTNRDFVMARLLAARAAAASSVAAIDETAALFLDPEDDKNGKARAELLEEADTALGVAAQLVQQAMEAYPDINLADGEDLDDPDDGDDDGEEDDEDDDDDDERPAKRRRRS